MRHSTRYLMGSMLVFGSLTFAGACKNGSNNAGDDSSATAGSYGAQGGTAGGALAPAPAPGDTGLAAAGGAPGAAMADTTASAATTDTTAKSRKHSKTKKY